MPFLSNLNKGETLDSASDDTVNEEQYQKLFKKIARDFLTKEDFRQILSEVLSQLAVSNPTALISISSSLSSLDDQNAAKSIAIEYEKNINTASNKKKKYKDII
jgi:hypothetical protein